MCPKGVGPTLEETVALLAARVRHLESLEQPTRPAFLVQPAVNQLNIATGGVVTVVFGGEVFDIGGNFAANTFTAPVTGKYHFDISLRLLDLDSAGGYYLVQLITSNRTYTTIMSPGQFTADVTHWSWSFGVLADMDVGDTAYVGIYQDVGAAQTDIITSSWFSGFLAC